MSQDFCLLHLRPNLNRLLPWAIRQGMVSNRGQGDLGYAFHAALKAVFGDCAPQPFSYRPGHGLLAYSAQPEALLLAATLASPELAEMLGLDATPASPGLSIRAFPKSWQIGQRLSFELRVRPVVRQGDKEIDAFLSAAQRLPNAVLSREVVYADWLNRQFAAVAQLTEVAITAFSLSTVMRRSAPQSQSGRPLQPSQGPDVSFHGVLQVTDSAAFSALLARGVGRHRAFGFGMLLLKPAAVR